MSISYNELKQISALKHAREFRPVFHGAHEADVTADRSLANEFLAMHGMSAAEPRLDEEASTYRRRALQSILPLSNSRWSGANPFTLDQSILGTVWKDTIADGLREFKKSEGPLRQMVTRDDSGRTLRRFYGNPANCWDQFAPKTQRFVCAWNPDELGHGAKSHTAVVPVSMTMSDGTVREAR